MPTGTGKSLTMALLASRLGLRTLIIVPTLGIKEQLREAFKGLFGTTTWLTIENIDSKKLKTLKNFDVLMIDEAHHVAARTYRRLNKTAWTNIPYRFFFTATPFRNQTEEQVLFESIAGEVIYSLSYKKAIAKGYIVPIEAFYYDLPKQKTDAYTYAQVYSELVVNNVIRNELIASLLNNLKEAKISTLCLVKEIKHGENLKKLTDTFFANGTDEDTEHYITLFNRERAKTLIGTTGILGEGRDTKPCEFVIIAGLGKAKSQFMQQVGRSVRRHGSKESAKVVLFRDPSHKFLLTHFREQVRVLKDEYGIEITKLEV